MKRVLLRWWLSGQRERLEMAVAWRLPRWLVYWAAIRLIAYGTTGRYGATVVPELSAMDALKRWRP